MSVSSYHVDSLRLLRGMNVCTEFEYWREAFARNLCALLNENEVRVFEDTGKFIFMRGVTSVS